MAEGTMWEQWSGFEQSLQDGCVCAILRWLLSDRVFQLHDLIKTREVLIILQKADNPTRHTAWFHINAMIRGMQNG